jgi:two-component system response regulator
MRTPVLMLVEDDIADVELARVALAEVGVPLQLEVFVDGRDALDRLQRTPPYESKPAPALVLLDLNIPHIRGLELLRRVKENPATRAIPMVVFSGTDDESIVQEVYRNHANAYLRKPSDLDGFTQALRTSAEYWLGQVLPGK